MQLVAAGQTLYFTWFNLGKAFPYISLPHLFSNKLQLNVNKYPLYIKVEAKITEHRAPSTDHKQCDQMDFRRNLPNNHSFPFSRSVSLSLCHSPLTIWCVWLLRWCDVHFVFVVIATYTNISAFFFVALMLFMLSIFGVVTLHWHLFI